MEKHSSVVNALADCVTIVEREGAKIVSVQHEKAQAEIALHGAHVISFKPQGQEDVIWLSEKADFSPEKAIRGGIPVCWPWFGRVAAPAHGFARTSEWALIEHRETEEGVIVCLGLEENEETLAVWPHAFQARLYVEVSEKLKVTLDVTNTDDKEWKFSGALHTYFNIADIRESVTTGMGAEYIDSLQEGKICQGGAELQLTDTVDRVYTQPEELIKISDPKNSRTIEIRNSGDNSAVIWNPWAEGAAGMGDMQDNGWETMLCVESTLHAKSIEEGKILAPEESYQLVTEISVG
ncbi:D-hexose-6-phosphate mutarotase [Vibrio sp. JC009]|uniref:D-hexose-6-phosphate mutarotase n=1 Tax=Vibrio sp. JC009 TaxID=2912314 RepID=UPI0023B04613|nr:D-hexose-6-phosphate mutarotase [Vibrio sp. JC009]WED20948.1 D-hexose-6-phosphate mutarotase [Vibrio sp. JC009]